ncbi:G-type lectin S-receptor-like serine/threonine-protein kinase SD2-5 [Nymphaea colorata]|uniref:G-type lectin S-receptor-like serine/threonine-protein kinase SD2-5 n=1 Tax=Nymphaea colorata TaxID=210225 RepID=UPI00214E98C9|nr:G-type lectin S-receptor-like serine/threonine-protein kinase SD2-5 [Nymphaea colorata]
MENCGIIFLTCCCYLFLISSAQLPPFLAVGKNFIWNVSSEGYILQTQSTNPTFACGFHSNGTSYYFSVFMSADLTSSSSENQTVMVWTANRDEHLDASSILRLSQDGNLELVDGGRDVIWKAGTADNYKRHQLKDGQKLTSSSSSTNASYFVSTKDGDLSAFIDDGPPQMYLQLKDFSKTASRCINTGNSTGRLRCGPTKAQFLITFSLYRSSPKTVRKTANHFIRLESDGRLMVYDWNTNENEWMSSDLGNPYSDACLYPLKCGRFVVCKDGQCSCPITFKGEDKYFKHLDPQLPDKGCEEVGSVPSCKKPNDGSLVDFGNYSYFAYVDPSAPAGNIVTLNACREACLNHCSCHAVFFNSQNGSTPGNCYLFDQVFSIRVEPLYNQAYTSRAFVKVSSLSISQPQPPMSESQGEGEQHRNNKYAKSIIGIAVGSLAVAVFVAGTIMFLVKRKREEEDDEEEDELDQLPGMMPRRFSYEELKTATGDFQMILGQGGFGAVFRGVLSDGIQVAVKRLDNKGQGTKEFVAEVQTIGRIHHMNLMDFP